MRRNKSVLAFPILACALALCFVLSGCQPTRLAGLPGVQVRAVFDSAVVNNLADQSVKLRDAGLKRLARAMEKCDAASKQLGTLGLADFLNSDDYKRDIAAWESAEKLSRQASDQIGNQPGFEVPSQTRISTLRASDAFSYAKVRFEDGPAKGKVGWVSRGDIDDPRNKMM